MTMQDTLTLIYELMAEGHYRKAIDVLFNWVDDACLDGRFEDVDQFIQEIDIDRLDTHLCVGVLSITFAPAPHLPSRPNLVERIEARLTELAPDRVDRLMSGLRKEGPQG